MNLVDVNVDVNKAQFAKVKKLLAHIPKGLPRAISKGLNATTSAAKMSTAKNLATQTGFKLSAVKKGLRIKKATRKNWVSSVSILDSRIPLAAFGARQTKKGVSYKMANEKKLIEGAFIAKMPLKKSGGAMIAGGGHKGVYKRKGSSRLPIKELYGPSIGVITQRRIIKIEMRKANRMLPKKINHEVRFLLKKYGKGA